ncbi:MAG TPA: phosphate acyltransferase PlsX [Micromonosporaceae bacterium]
MPKEPGTARIAVDLLGGDAAPAVVVDGALRALAADPDLRLLLVGPLNVADEFFAALPNDDHHRVHLIATPSPAGSDGHRRPVHSSASRAALMRANRTGTTVRAAVAAVAEGAADALVSAGDTGATVTGAALGLGRWPGVRRPALVATMPAVAGPVVLLDVGGSLEAKPATLARHAVLGAAYAAVLHGIRSPRVGLLSVGTEPGKGDRARLAADGVLARLTLPADARYVGLVEGYDVSLGERADVVVTDGFTGNVLLKGIEGAYAMAGLPAGAEGAPRAAALLGVGGTVVVCHGAARLEDIAAGIALAADLHRREVIAAVSALHHETEVSE